MLYVRQGDMDEGRANQRNKPTVGDRPRALSPPLLSTAPHIHDELQQDEDDDDGDDDDDNDEEDDDDDDWDEVRSVCCHIICSILLTASAKSPVDVQSTFVSLCQQIKENFQHICSR